MVKASFEHDGNLGTLSVTTHFGRTVSIPCEKTSDEVFRLGGTAINAVALYEGVILDLEKSRFRAFRSIDSYFEDTGILSDEKWNDANQHCYIIEYYSLDMEGSRPGWFISKKPIKDANYIFINLDILDGGLNLIRRCRVSPFTGGHKWLT